MPGATDKVQLMTERLQSATDKVQLMTERFPTDAEDFSSVTERSQLATERFRRNEDQKNRLSPTSHPSTTLRVRTRLRSGFGLSTPPLAERSRSHNLPIHTQSIHLLRVRL